MSILGTVVRCRPEDQATVLQHIQACPGAEVALDAGDGRLVVLIEDTTTTPAASSMAALALCPQVLNLSLVYEYSGDDIPSANPASADPTRYQAWRTSLSELAEGRHVQAH